MGLEYGGEATFLHTMVFLKGICDSYMRYALAAGILWYWLKVNILWIGWETDIENKVGRELVPIKDKHISKVDCKEVCGLFSKC